MYRRSTSFYPFTGLLDYGASFIGAMSGISLAAQGAITDLQLRAMSTAGPKGRQMKNRSRYTPAGPSRNCGERGISPKLMRRHG